MRGKKGKEISRGFEGEALTLNRRTRREGEVSAAAGQKLIYLVQKKIEMHGN
jgi:hypothetical protein